MFKLAGTYIYKNCANLLSLLGVAPLFILFQEGGFQYIIPLIIYNNILDDLDGFIAKKLKIRSQYGSNLDNICDDVDTCIGNSFACNELHGTCGENCKIVCPPGNSECQGDFNSIQEAIDFVADGDTVFVAAGTYYENIYIDKFIHLIG